MSRGNSPDKDQDLQSRLNALRRTAVKSEPRNIEAFSAQPHSPPISLLPAHDLHAELVTRFKSLSGQQIKNKSSTIVEDNTTPIDDIGNETDKTFEEILAGLGPAEVWDIDKSEQSHIEDLLNTAKEDLSRSDYRLAPSQNDAVTEKSEKTKETNSVLTGIDVEAFQLEPDSEEDKPSPSEPLKSQQGIDKESEDVLQKLLDELKLDSVSNHIEYEDSTQPDSPGKVKSTKIDTQSSSTSDIVFPAVPSNKLSSWNSASDRVGKQVGEEDLAARFASLSVPSHFVKGNPLSKTTLTKQNGPAYTDEEIDSWCIICNDDATLKCLGCDGDLYCTNCWMEGHQSEDAGSEERKHKAVQYVKGGGKKKQRAKPSRTMMGA